MKTPALLMKEAFGTDGVVREKDGKGREVILIFLVGEEVLAE